MKKRIKKFDKKFKDIETQHKNLQKNIRDLRDAVKDREGDLSTTEELINKFKDEVSSLRENHSSLMSEYNDLSEKYNTLKKQYQGVTEDAGTTNEELKAAKNALRTANSALKEIDEQRKMLEDLGYDVLIVKMDGIRSRNAAEFMTRLQEKAVGSKYESAKDAAASVAEREIALKRLKESIEKMRPTRNPILQEYWYQFLIFLSNCEPASYGAAREGEKVGEKHHVKIWDNAILSIIKAIIRMFEDSDTLASMRAIYSLEAQLPSNSEFEDMWKEAHEKKWNEAEPLVRRILEMGDSSDYRLLGFFKIFADQIYELVKELPQEEKRVVVRTFLTACGVAFEDMLKRYLNIILKMRDDKRWR
jgi:DNA-binding protein H-NS